MSDNSAPAKLRMMTYMVPGLPLSLYQLYQRYLEESLGLDSYMMVESRWSGPPPGHRDPFAADDADIGFMCSSSFLQHHEARNAFIEFLPVMPIHIHPKNDMQPVYFAEVIIRKAQTEKYQEFINLQGSRWAYNDEVSLSGNLSILLHLKRLGLNANFFGHIMHSGSHHNSIEMLLDGRVDAAAIDSNVLQYFLLEHPEYKDRLHVMTSIGPLPAPPIVVNSRMNSDLKKKIVTALLNMNKSVEWQAELAKNNVWGFKAASVDIYDEEKEIKDMVKGLSVRAIYY